ncbi:heparinase II/III family protein [Humitalea sp. 24SJ18S-53]|uniref:heparinase II/III family protein n=1 Tax=Humitalea sp. 24SJ18S-53 TaxID=3422307 RepID=UPI003D66772D
MVENFLRGARQMLAGLKPVRAPDAPARAFRDLWPGDAARGNRLLQGEFEFLGSARALTEETGWDQGSLPWRAAAHAFGWARDLRALGTDAARLRGRGLTAAFLGRWGADPLAAVPEVAGARISAWLGHWDFFFATAEDSLRRGVMQRMAQDVRTLVAGLPAEAAHRGALAALKGAMAGAVALDDEAALSRCLRFLTQELERQFLPDGCHVERSPAQHLLALQDLVEIRNLLHGAGVESPPHLAMTLDRAAPALRLFRHGDGGLAGFNGTREEAASLLDLTLTQAQARGRSPLALPDGGFQRMQAQRTLVIVDAGPPPPGRAGTGLLPRGADRFHHAGTLSFEMSVGRDRVIVNCGAAPAADAGWRDALRATAAHSTLIVADTNSSELQDTGLGRRPEAVEAERQETGGAQWLEIAHDGYRKPFGAVHRRRIYLSESGDDLRGEDVLEAEKPMPFTVRFHLHPGVSATAQQDEQAVMLRLPSGAGWRIRVKGARVAVEESIYLAAEPRRTVQVALYADDGEQTVQWAISRISLAGPDPAAT